MGEQGCTCSVLNPHVLVRKLVELIGDPIPSGFSNRHFLLLGDFLQASPHGFWVCDVPYVIRLVEEVSQKSETVPEYRNYLVCILKLCSIPPLLARSSEVIDYRTDVQEYFSLFGDMLVYYQDPELQGLVFDALSSLLTRRKPLPNNRVTLDFCKKQMAESRLAEIVAQLLEVADEEFYVKLLKLAELIAVMERPCLVMVKMKTIDVILIRLPPGWDCRGENQPFPEVDPANNVIPKNLQLSLKVVWKLIGACRRLRPKLIGFTYAPSMIAWHSMHYAFRSVCLSRIAKYWRNTILGIMLMILDSFDDTVVSGYTDVPSVGDFPRDIAFLCVAPEFQDKDVSWASNIVFTCDDMDYKFKKMLLLYICYFPRYPALLSYLEKCKVIIGLLIMLTRSRETIWNNRQRCNLILCSLTVINIIGQYVLPLFIENSGPIILLNIIKQAMCQGLKGGVVLAALRAIHGTIKTYNREVIDVYRTKLAMDVIICYVDHLFKKDILTKDLQNNIICAFCILQKLNKEYEYSNEKVVTIIMPYLKRYLLPKKGEMIHDPKIMISLFDFLWKNLSSSTSNLKYFVKIGGVYTIMDIIEVSCLPVKVMGLSLLVDFVEEGSCLPHLLTWRGKSSTIVPMLLSIFREENKQLGVKVNEQGVIQDIELPLMGREQWRQTFAVRKDPNCSPATIDLLGSCRPKIYAILQLLECRHKDNAECVREHYKIESSTLKVKDQVTKLLAENYLPLKLGETWIELSRDIDVSGIRPLSFDQEVIATLVKRFYRWALHIKTVQEEVLKKKKEQDSIDERLLYNMLREGGLASSLDALEELRYIARCTETLFRLTAKMKQKYQLNKSLSYDREFFIKFHGTFRPGASFTPVFKQKLYIKSNTIVDPNEEPFDLEPVSPEDSVDEFC